MVTSVILMTRRCSDSVVSLDRGDALREACTLVRLALLPGAMPRFAVARVFGGDVRRV